MSYTSEHRRLAPVLVKARLLDIATHSAPEALFEALTAGVNIWCTLTDHPEGWDGIPLIAGAFAKPCGFVGTATWKWEGEQVIAVSLGTDAYDLADHCPEAFAREAHGDWFSIHNRPEDIDWAEGKIRWLFEKAGVPCPEVVNE